MTKAKRGRLVYIAKSVLPSETANSVHVARMCAALEGAGGDVRLFAHRGTPPCDMAAIMAQYGLARGFDLHLYDMARWWDRKTWRVRAVLAAGNAPILTRDVHVAARAAHRGKTIFEVHHPPGGKRGRASLKKALHAGAAIVCITRALADHMARHFAIPPERLHVLQDAADPVGEVAPRNWATGSGRPVAGYVGGLMPGKGAELVARLARRVPDVDFVIIGGPEARRVDLEKTAPVNLRVLPRVAPSEVPACIAGFDLALLPNQRRVESAGDAPVDIGAWTSPLKAFEYMALGRAIIASDLPNLREVFGPHNAVLCAPDDEEAWTQAITSLSRDADRRAALGSQAQRDLERQYSWDCRAERMLEIIDTL